VPTGKGAHREVLACSCGSELFVPVVRAVRIEGSDYEEATPCVACVLCHEVLTLVRKPLEIEGA
jgi:hypothetical protein